MKLAVFGGTGGVGRYLVAQCLAAGNRVTVLARDPGKMKGGQTGLEIVQGDVLDPTAVAKALEGADAVLCALGAPMSDKSGIRTKGTRVIVDQMRRTGVSRMICLSSFGVGDSHAALPAFYRWIIFPLLLKHVMADHGGQEDVLRGSDLDWVIVRPTNLTDGPATTTLQTGFVKPKPGSKMKVSRADVANFMVSQLGSTANLGRAVAVTN